MKVKITPPKRGAYRYKRKKGECVGRSYAPRPRRRKPTKPPVDRVAP